MIKHIFLILFLHLFIGNVASAMDKKTFRHLAIKNIYKVIPADKEKLSLADKPKEAIESILIYGKDDEKLKELKCNFTTVFSVVAYETLMGTLTLSVCDYSNDLSHYAIKSMKNKLLRTIAPLKDHGGKSVKKLKDTGFSFDGIPLNNGATVYHFPITAISHGVLILKTTVMIPADKSFVVIIQHYPEELCKATKDNRLCEKDNKGISDIATGLMSDYRKHK